MSSRLRLVVERKTALTNPDWDESEHPRDHEGRFIEKGAIVRILTAFGAVLAEVVKNVGGGRIQVKRQADGKQVVVHRNSLEVVTRPDGGKPTSERADAPEPVAPEDADDDAEDQTADQAAATEGPAPAEPDVDPDAKPGYAPGGQVEQPATQEETVTTTNLPDTPTEATLPDNVVAELDRLAGLESTDPDALDDIRQSLAHGHPEDALAGAWGAGFEDLADMLGEDSTPAARQTQDETPLPDIPATDKDQAAALADRAHQWEDEHDDFLDEIPTNGRDAIEAAIADGDYQAAYKEIGNWVEGDWGFVLDDFQATVLDYRDEPTRNELDNIALGNDGTGTVRDAIAAPIAADKPDEDDEAGETVPLETVYTFPTDREHAAIASIDTANRRAERAGIPERFTYEISHEDRKIERDRDGSVLPIPYYRRYTTLTLNRPTVEHDGWTFAATLTWDPEAGLITRVAPGATLHKRPEARRCDVCKSARDRKDTYVVQRADGAEKQVGSNCLTQFMGIRPAGLWMLGFEPTGGGEEDDDNENQGYRGGGNYRLPSRDLLALALAVVNEKGWTSRSQANAERTPTADIVNSILHDRGGREEDRRWREKMVADSLSLGDEAATLLDFARTMDGDSEYVTNLRAAAAPESVDPRNAALLMSVIAASTAHKERIAKRRAEADAAAASTHIGKVGDKITEQKVRVIGVRTFENNFGPRGGMTTLLTFLTPDGNVIKWFASGDKTNDVKIDTDITLSGTIKGHGEYRGVAETTITRGKIQPVGDALDAAKEAEKQARKERAAARKAEREALKAATERLETAVPEGFTAATGPQPVGARVRISAEQDDSPLAPRGIETGWYDTAIVVSEPGPDGTQVMRNDGLAGPDIPFELQNRAPYDLRYATTKGIPSSRIVAAMPPTPESLGSAQEILDHMRVLPGMEKSVSFYQADDPMALARNTYPIGTTVRVDSPGGEMPTKYVNATVVGYKAPTPPSTTMQIVVQMPDGTEIPLFPSGITAYMP